MMLKPYGYIQGQPNWQLVRVKDYKRRLALPALLNRQGLHAQSVISRIQLKKKEFANMYMFIFIFFFDILI